MDRKDVLAPTPLVTPLEELMAERQWEEQLAPHLSADVGGDTDCHAAVAGGTDGTDHFTLRLAHQCTWCSGHGRALCECAMAAQTQHHGEHAHSRHHRSVLSERYDAEQVRSGVTPSPARFLLCTLTFACTETFAFACTFAFAHVRVRVQVAFCSVLLHDFGLYTQTPHLFAANPTNHHTTEH